MKLILFDEPLSRDYLKPITLTRPIGEIRIGILKIAEKWEKYSRQQVGFLTEDYLQAKFPTRYSGEDTLYVNASCLPNVGLFLALQDLEEETCLRSGEHLVAVRTRDSLKYGFGRLVKKEAQYKGVLTCIDRLPQLFLSNGSEIEEDFALLECTASVISDPFTRVYGSENVFVGKNADIKAAIINAENGPVYIGEGAIIQEGAILVGPVAICENAMVGYGAKIRQNTTVGPYCRVAGEVSNAIFHEYTNKAHDGFLGNSYLGAWCNLGANTNNSNLKNNYKPVALHSYSTGGLYDTGTIFCGTFMGDYSKAGISTMFNTGTSVGVSVNVFGAGFQEKYIPSFSWGGKDSAYEKYRFGNAIDTIKSTLSRKGIELSDLDIEILKHISGE